ncbi:MAG: transcriptional regulator [Bacteroidetes bacterium RBG_13_42_15]|nr:MAG: transcriptional regulator [Bacteroidetes bacterium RBG_13_42_15]
MKQISMVDLAGQYLRIKDEMDSAIQGVIDSTAFIKGCDVRAFEEELAAWLQASYVISCGNCTDALQIALMSLDLQPGDEVITTPFSFISTIEVIRLLKLVPVLVDIRPDTFNMDENLIERVISDHTKAIIPVHLFGQCARMETIMEIASRNKIHVIEDAAQSTGTDYFFSNGSQKKAGTIGIIGCTSFFPTKNLACYGDGGALFTNDEKLAVKLRAIVNHGQSQKYYYDFVGVNSRLDTIQAAILRVKLKYLADYNNARIKAAEFYDKAFSPYPQIKIPYRAEYSSHIFHQYTLTLYGLNRDGLRNYLKENQIPSMVYYPLPFHLQKAFLDMNWREGDFPVAEEISKSVLSLPMHTELDEEQLAFITHHVIHFINNH